MSEHDPNEMNNAGSRSPNGLQDGGRNPETNQSVDRPYGDAGNLYEIPRVRPDDPPMRQWWIDDETQHNDGSPENG